MLRTTPFHPRTAPLCQAQNWRRWAGYAVASSYELLHDREYHAIRSSAALIDVSPLYKYLVTGPDAARLLDRVVTRDVAGTKVNQVLYTPWCDAHGKQIDDGTVSRLAEDAFRFTAAEPNLRWLHLNSAGLRVSVEDVSDRVAAVAVQGPAARDVVACAADADLGSLKFFRLTTGTIDGTGDARVDGWAAGDVSFLVTDVDNTAGTYRGGAEIEVIEVTTTFDYADVGFLSALGFEPISIDAAHEQRVILE